MTPVTNDPETLKLKIDNLTRFLRQKIEYDDSKHSIYVTVQCNGKVLTYNHRRINIATCHASESLRMQLE